MDTSRYLDRVVVVTGAASGIGRATALQLAREGARLIVTDVNDSELRTTAARVGEIGAECSAVTADIADPAAATAVLAAADTVGPTHMLANVAGVMDHFLPVTETDDDTWQRVLGVNLYGPFSFCRAFLPGMVERGGGVVVNVGSMASTVGGLGGTSYTASKHGLAGLTRSIAFFYGPRSIRCNLVIPGGVATGIMASAEPRSDWAFERFQVQYARGTRVVEPEEIAPVVSWLGSDESANMNGAIVHADGGMSAY